MSNDNPLFSKLYNKISPYFWVSMYLCCICLVACDDEPSQTMVDMTVQDDLGGDAADLDAETMQDMDLTEPDSMMTEPVVEVLPDPQDAVITQRNEVDWGTWWVTRDSSNMLYSVLERAEIEGLIDGEGYGVSWAEAELSEEGNLDVLRLSRTFYAMTKITLEAESHLVLRLGGVVELAVNGQRIPGDAYNMGRSLVPLTLPAGEHWIMAYIVRRGIPNIKGWQVDQEIDFNLDDITFSDLRVSDTRLSFPVGVPVLNLNSEALSDVEAWVLEDDRFHASRVKLPSLPALAVSQIPFDLKLKAPIEDSDVEQDIEVQIQIQAGNLSPAVKTSFKLKVKAHDRPYRVSFVSPVDGSVQYYGVRAPLEFNPQQNYASVLSLHGASVEAINQAASYSPKDWAFIIAATNRRPFGFDWEEWGHLNALASLEHARTLYPFDPSRSYLVGHSMGGHGTWHVGVHHPGLFATLAPSAGWESFYSYGGANRPSEPVAWARAHSDTLEFLDNLANRGVYILHGDQDESVPVSEGRNMYEKVSQISLDVVYHEEAGAIHWWDGDASEGVDCVDWPPMFEFMQQRSFDPDELEFSFKSPSPAYSAKHSYLTISSAHYLGDPVQVISSVDMNQVSLFTENVRSMSIDLTALRAKEITELIIDGDLYDLATIDESKLWIGPTSGKQKDRYGNHNQVYQKPFCWIYPDANEGTVYKHIASYLTTTWQLIGNGHACALPWSKLELAETDQRNLIFIGFDLEWLQTERGWDTQGITWRQDQPDGILIPSPDEDNGVLSVDGAGLVIRPSQQYDGVELALFASPNKAYLLYRFEAFNSRGGLPDMVVLDESGARLLGYYGMEWEWKPEWMLFPNPQ